MSVFLLLRAFGKDPTTDTAFLYDANREAERATKKQTQRAPTGPKRPKGPKRKAKGSPRASQREPNGAQSPWIYQ